MRTRNLWLPCLALVTALWSVPASAQRGPVDASVLHLGAAGAVCQVRVGSGSPEGAATAPVCTVYLRTDGALGSMVWLKTSGSGNTGWQPVVTTTGAQHRLPFFAATDTLGTSATLTFNASTSMLTTPGVTASGEASIVDVTAAMIRQRRAYQTRYGSDWFVGYDGATWLTAFDTTGNTFMPLILRGSTVRTLGPVRFGGVATADDDIVANANVGTSDYVSQTTGWRVTDGGELDVRYLYTDELRAKIFSVVLEQVLVGAHTVSKSVALISHPFTCPSLGGSATLSVEDIPGASNMLAFESGDWVVARQYSRASGSLTIADCAGQVSSGSTSPDGYQTWTFTRGMGSSGGSVTGGAVLEEGGAAIDFGVSGNGVYRVTAVDGQYGINSPYAAIDTWTTAPVSGNFTRRCTYGNLRGVTSVTGEFGFLCGTYSTTTPYIRASTSAVEMNNVALGLREGGTKTFSIDPSGPFWAMGNPLPTAYGTGTGCWAGLDGGVYKFRCGNPAGEKIAWNGSTLEIVGDINVTGISLIDAAAPSGDGLYIGSDYMGFYGDGAWRTYLDSDGNFALGTKLTFDYDAGTLSIDGSGTFTGTLSTTNITATGGTVGGWTLSSTSLTAGSGGTTVGMDSGGTNPAIYAGSATPGSAPFRVTPAGALFATNATITGAITATSGSFAGSLSGATGTFAGSLSAATGTFAGDLSAAGGTFAGDLSAAGGTFAGDLSAAGGTFDGALSAATGTLGALTVEGAMTVGTSGVIRSGASTWSTGDGYILDYNAGNPRMRIGSAGSGERFIYEGGALDIIADTFTLNSTDGLTFDGVDSGASSINWGAGARVNGTSSRLSLFGPGSSWAQINLSNDGRIRMWVGISGDTDPHIEVTGTEIYSAQGLALGWSGAPWGGLHVSPPSTTASRYPLVLHESEVTYKTDGLDGTGGCSVVGDLTVELGIVTGVSCSSLQGEVAILRSEVEQLKAIVARLSSMGVVRPER